MATPQKPERGTEASEAHIAVHWKEEELYRPSKKFIEQANLKDPKVTERDSRGTNLKRWGRISEFSSRLGFAWGYEIAGGGRAEVQTDGSHWSGLYFRLRLKPSKFSRVA
jgi:hypothetical protein